MMPERFDPAPKKVETERVLRAVWERLPAIASGLIRERLDQRDPRNRYFAAHPDDRGEHVPQWHQWGIITHTRMFEKAYREEVPAYLEAWGLSDRAAQAFAADIDGIPKKELLSLAIAFHDLGKFTARRIIRRKGAPAKYSFYNHETESGRVVRDEQFAGMLRGTYNLTPAHIEYIARAAELHYALGTVREKAKQSPFKYTLAFAESEPFRKEAERLIEQYGDFAFEIGILFLGDSLAKTDIRIEGSADEEIQAQRPHAEALLAARGLPAELAQAVLQVPVNRAIVERYLRIWSGTVPLG